MSFDRRSILIAATGSATGVMLSRLGFAQTAPPDTFREL